MSDGETQPTGKAAKRARKKAFRDEQRAAWEAALRRRRNARLAIGAALIGGLVVAAFAVTAGEDQNEEPPQAAAETPGCPRSGEPPVEPNPQTYEKPPPMRLEDGVDYGAIITTSCGDITIDLAEDSAPINVNNFVFLAREGFYDGLTFHRVERNVVIQGGDPEGTGAGGPGYSVPDELPKRASQYVSGVVGMANSGPDTAGSQFFIVAIKEGVAGYDPNYTIIGQVADEASFEVIKIIGKQPVGVDNDPARAVEPKVPIYIESIEITEN